MTSKRNQQTDRMLTEAAEAAKAGPASLPQIPPIPLPCAIQVATPDAPVGVPQRDGTVKQVKDFVLLQYQTPAGSGLLWLEPAQADQIASGLTQAAAAQRAGIVLAK